MTDPWDDCLFTYIWLILVVNVGKYTIHGCYGFYIFWTQSTTRKECLGFCCWHIDGTWWDLKICLQPKSFETLPQWLFLVPIKGGKWHIIPQLAVYIPLIYCLLGEPETTIDYTKSLQSFFIFCFCACPEALHHQLSNFASTSTSSAAPNLEMRSSDIMLSPGAKSLVYRSKYKDCLINKPNSRGNFNPLFPATWAVLKTLLTFHDTGCFIGILNMACYNPYIPG